MRSFLAALIGLLVGNGLILILENLSIVFFPIPEKDKIDPSNVEQLRHVIDHIPISALIVVIAAHAIGTFIGSMVTHKIQPKTSTPFLVLILLMLIFTISNLARIPHPTWFIIADISGVLVAILLAWRIFYRRV